MGAELNEVAVFAAVTIVGMFCAAIVDASPVFHLWHQIGRTANACWLFTGVVLVQVLVLLTVRTADFFEIDFESLETCDKQDSGSSW